MRDNIYTADMGQPPMEPDGGSAPPPPRTATKEKGKDKGDTYTLGGGRQVRTKEGEELYYDRDKGAYNIRQKKYAKGGAVSASKRADGCAQRGKTRGKVI